MLRAIGQISFMRLGYWSMAMVRNILGTGILHVSLARLYELMTATRHLYIIDLAACGSFDHTFSNSTDSCTLHLRDAWEFVARIRQQI
jgi:hypothetical protein